MANTFNTNTKTELVALRAAEVAGYLTVGSKSYCRDQLIGKRNGGQAGKGKSYEFVIRDTGKFVEGPDLTGQINDVTERAVRLELYDGAVPVQTNLIEGVTDVEWDKEVAQPNGQKLINGIVKHFTESDLGKQCTAFVGSGFVPLAKASAHLKSIADENLYGFIDPMIQAVLASNGQQFVAVGAPEMYKSGLIGVFHSAEYRASRFMPAVSISDALVSQIASATVTSYADDVSDPTLGTLTLSGVTEVVPAGTPIWIDGVYATDTVGDKTSAKRAFIAVADSSNGAVKIRKVNFSGEGTKTLCDANGKARQASDLAGKKVSCPEAGDYFTGIVRIDGAMEFDTLDKLDTSNAETKTASIGGVTVHENRAIDNIRGQNITRWDIVALAGIVEERGVAYVMVK